MIWHYSADNSALEQTTKINLGYFAVKQFTTDVWNITLTESCLDCPLLNILHKMFENTRKFWNLEANSEHTLNADSECSRRPWVHELAYTRDSYIPILLARLLMEIEKDVVTLRPEPRILISPLILLKIASDI